MIADDSHDYQEPAREQSSQQEAPLRINKNHKHRDRVWRPSPVAQLGVSSLGKPAEVLVLPSRDRKIPIVPTDDQSSQQKLQESLESESQPISPEQIKENIEQVRDQIGLPRGPLEEQEWKRLRQNLSKGFTAKQLSGYIEQEQGNQVKKFRLFRTKPNWKQQMAHHIAKHIWGFSGPETTEAVKQVTARSDLKISRQCLEVLLLLKTRPLQALSESHDVEVDVFRDQDKIALSGTRSNVASASTAFASMKKTVKKALMPSDDTNASTRTWTADMSSRFYKAMGKKYAVVIESVPKSTELQVYHHLDDRDVIANLRREILLANRSAINYLKFKTWPSEQPSTESLAPVYPNFAMPWSQYELHWGRLAMSSTAGASLRTISNLAENDRHALGEIYDGMRMDLRDSKVELHPNKSHALYEDFHAHFGRFLFDQNDLAIAEGIHPNDNSLCPQSTFISQIPFLSQFLASLQPRKHQGIPINAATPQDGVESPFLFRLVLVPAKASEVLPEIEIHLVGSSRTAGLDQPLQIHDISTILDRRFHCLLLPGNTVDVQFVREVKSDIYTATARPEAKHTILLQQIGKYLNEAAAKTRPDFSPFVELSIPLQLLSTSWRPSKQTEESKSVLSAKSQKHKSLKKADGQSSTADYVLARAEVVDVASFRPPIASKLFLNHSIEDGLQWGGITQRLSLARKPLFGHEQGEKVKFVGFFNTAYEVALHLGSSRQPIR